VTSFAGWKKREVKLILIGGACLMTSRSKASQVMLRISKNTTGRITGRLLPPLLVVTMDKA